MKPATREQIIAAARALNMTFGLFKRREDLTNNIFVEWCKQVYMQLLHQCQEASLADIKETLLGI